MMLRCLAAEISHLTSRLDGLFKLESLADIVDCHLFLSLHLQSNFIVYHVCYNSFEWSFYLDLCCA